MAAAAAPLLLLFLLIPSSSPSFVFSPHQAPGHSRHSAAPIFGRPPTMSISVPAPAPAFSPNSSPHIPRNAAPKASHFPLKHHHRRGRSHHTFSPPQGCDDILCSEPLTSTPIGSPCGCVLPIKIDVDLNVATYLLFTHVAELEIEIAGSTFLKQSQVKIMAAVPSVQDQQRTRVTIYLVPLRDEFDSTSALLIFERFWQHKISLDKSVFGDYEVINVDYPGLPASPPSIPQAHPGLGPSKSRGEYPLIAEVPPHSNGRINRWVVIVITVSSLTLILACLGVVLFVLRWRKLKQVSGTASPPIMPEYPKRPGMRSVGLRSSTLSTSMASSASPSVISTMATCPSSVKTFLLSELEQATDRFNSKRVLGQGGFGRVYYGILEDGMDVAVKLLTREDRSGDREFIAEVEMLSRLHHRNLVKLIGICVEVNKRCLVYELIRNGSVESHLHGADKEKGLLNWDIRMKIALGAARGLAYLHEDANPRVIHRDFKASNILLEEDFTPKVTDFGLAREASEGTNHISTRVMGTFGYVAPEYAMTGHLLVKSDVYSYGVVLLELLSGRKPVYMSKSDGPENLVTWARPLLGIREGLEKLVDPSLQGNFDFDNVAKVASIASMCVHIEPSQRPFMGEVVQALKLIYNGTDEACDESQRESSSGPDYDFRGGFFPESSGWWNRASPTFDYRNSSPLITMEYSSGRVDEHDTHRPHSAASAGARLEEPVALQNRSGPLRNKKRFFTQFYRSRGSISEHDHLRRNQR